MVRDDDVMLKNHDDDSRATMYDQQHAIYMCTVESRHRESQEKQLVNDNLRGYYI